MSCTCHSIREGSGGVTYSLAMLGVQCGHCESISAEYEEQARIDALTPEERVRERIATRWSLACWRVRDMRPTRRGFGRPPF